MPKWLLDDALGVIRALQPQTRQFGYHLCLGGGVLNKGESEKDLDLYFLPMNQKDLKADGDGMLQHLKSLWGESEDVRDGRWRTSVHQPDPGIRYEVREVNRRMEVRRVPDDGSLNPPYDDVDDSPYLHKVKFRFAGGAAEPHRIDVFILQGAESVEQAQPQEPAEAETSLSDGSRPPLNARIDGIGITNATEAPTRSGRPFDTPLQTPGDDPNNIWWRIRDRNNGGPLGTLWNWNGRESRYTRDEGRTFHPSSFTVRSMDASGAYERCPDPRIPAAVPSAISWDIETRGIPALDHLYTPGTWLRIDRSQVPELRAQAGAPAQMERSLASYARQYLDAFYESPFPAWESDVPSSQAALTREHLIQEDEDIITSDDAPF